MTNGDGTKPTTLVRPGRILIRHSSFVIRHSRIAMRRVRASVDPPAALDDDLVQVGVIGTAADAALAGEVLDTEGVVLEVERDDIGVGRDGVDALLAPRP